MYVVCVMLVWHMYVYTQRVCMHVCNAHPCTCVGIQRGVYGVFLCHSFSYSSLTGFVPDSKADWFG